MASVVAKWGWVLVRGAGGGTREEKFWDMLADGFDQQTKDRFQPLHVKMLECARVHLKSGDVVLDVGCATGRATIELASGVGRIHGIDISSKMIEAARKRASRHPIENADFEKMTVFDGRLVSGTFDAVVAFNVLHLFEDPVKAVSRIGELLNPGGLLISVTPCLRQKRSPASAFLSLLTRMRILPRFWLFKRAELEDSISRAGFKILETQEFRTAEGHLFILARKPQSEAD